MYYHFNPTSMPTAPKGQSFGYLRHAQLGLIEVLGEGGYITAITFVDKMQKETSTQPPAYIQTAILQLEEYFNGERREFELPLQVEGTEFEIKVWKELSQLPFGKTSSYKQLALTLGSENFTRPVGTANGKNKLAIIIPCHRVIASNGSLAGYAGEVWRKEWLLAHEGADFTTDTLPSTKQISLL